MHDPRLLVRSSSPHSVRLAATYKYLAVPTCPCKFLKTLVIHTLKRLASAVQLRPWPPHFTGFSITFHSSYYRQFTGS
jgi:hypothetical protein